MAGPTPPVDAFVPGPAGSNVRVLQVNALNPDGTQAIANAQVLVVSGPYGEMQNLGERLDRIERALIRLVRVGEMSLADQLNTDNIDGLLEDVDGEELG